MSLKIAMIGQKGIPAIHGGIERHVEELSVRLAARGNQVTVYTRPYFTPAEMGNYRGVNLVSMSSWHTKHFDAITHTFRATVHAVKSGADIIHYHGVGPSLLSFLPRVMGARAKVVATFHCVDRKHRKWGFVARQFLRFGEWSAVTYPHRTIAVSQTIKKYAREVYGRDLVYIPNGIEPQKKTHRSRTDVLRRYGLRRGEYIISVSRLIPHKGVHHLINAFRRIETKQKLVIVGDGFYTDEYVQYLHELAAEDPRIIFTGFQSGQALRDLFSQAAMYVLPSETEGMPIAMLEAASYGVGIIASDIPENREVVYADDRPVAMTFAVGDTDDLTRVLKDALRRPATLRQLGQRAKKLVENKFRWDDVAMDTERIYRQLVNQTRNVEVRGEVGDGAHSVAVSAS